jgi:hypothetical protein
MAPLCHQVARSSKIVSEFDGSNWQLSARAHSLGIPDLTALRPGKYPIAAQNQAESGSLLTSIDEGEERRRQEDVEDERDEDR